MPQQKVSTVAANLGPGPKVPFALTLGVTGHRGRALAKARDRVREDAAAALRLVAKVAAAVQAEEPQWFSSAPPSLNLLSPLADGADQIVAAAALDLGYRLHALLPFDRTAYRASLDGLPATFDSLIARAERVLELPGDSSTPKEGYVLAGRATVAHCDLLLAVWDGEPARGSGGTADVIELALRRGVAVLHLDPAGIIEPRLLWSGFDPAVVTERLQETVSRRFDEEHLAGYLAAILRPPADAGERRFAQLFANEKVGRFRTRIEYPLMLSAAGVRRFNPRTMSEAHCAAGIQEDWDRFERDCAGSHEVGVSLELLGACYNWSDRLATRLAQTYRSGHIFNFVLGGLAVCMGLVGNIFAWLQLPFALLEAAVAALILLNTKLGVGHEWHRRWLDYRQLAERLRPMRSLKLLAVAAPDPPGSIANPTPRRWTEWYALAVWRAMGCPSGRIEPRSEAGLGSAIAAHELAPQVAYHRRHAQQIDLLDHRLERISATLFLITLAVSCGVAVGAVLVPALVNRLSPWLTLVGAGFPALATAVFGIRFQGDFGGSAVRSENTASALDRIADELGGGPALSRAADLTEQAARIMLADLDEWRLVNQQQNLDLL